MPSPINISKVQPLPGYVLVKPAETDTQTASGILLPSKSDEKPQHGTVLAVSEYGFVGDEKIECPVKKDDKVIYKKWGGNDFKLGDVEYQFLKYEDVLAVIK